jgi:uncharacterized membrane protein YkvA (DUF1232 family)
MAVRAFSLLSRPALLGLLLRRIRLAVRLAREPRVPVTVKALLALPALYLISPIDLLPDLVPLLGQIDDLGVMMLALESFLKLCPQHLVSFHRDALDAMRPYSPVPDRDVVIDVPFKRG